MCYNCGCGMPDDDMGDPKNITNKTIDELSEINGMSRKKTLEEIKKSVEKELEKEKEGK